MHRLLVSIIVLSFAPDLAAAAEHGWRAGVARVNISPDLPIWLSGYGGRDKPAATKHDDLWAKALVLEDAAGKQVALVTMDLVGIDRELSTTVCQRIESQLKLPRSAIALCTSHTHSGPVIRGNLVPMFNLDEDQTHRVKEYKVKLADMLVGVVADAIQALQPATISCGVGEAGFAVNRRNNKEGQVPKLREAGKLQGPIDHELPVLTATSSDGKLLAIAAGYACHATVLSDYFISADWPGAAQNEIERRHSGATALFFAGCGADQNPLPRRSIALMEKYGKAFADGVDSELRSSLKPISPKLATAYEEIDLPFGDLPTRTQLEETAATGERPQSPWAKYLLSEWDRNGNLPAKYPYPVQVWRLGDNLTWVFLGGEVVVDYSLRLKAELGHDKTWIASYSNDVMGYIPSRRVLLEGGYEGGLARYPYGLPAPWGPEVEERIVAKVRELSAAVAK